MFYFIYLCIFSKFCYEEKLLNQNYIIRACVCVNIYMPMSVFVCLGAERDFIQFYFISKFPTS